MQIKSMNPTRRNAGDLKKILKLPSAYHVTVELNYRNEKGEWVQMRELASSTAGTVRVYAQSINWAQWREVPAPALRIELSNLEELLLKRLYQTNTGGTQ